MPRILRHPIVYGRKRSDKTGLVRFTRLGNRNNWWWHSLQLKACTYKVWFYRTNILEMWFFVLIIAHTRVIIPNYLRTWIWRRTDTFASISQTCGEGIHEFSTANFWKVMPRCIKRKWWAVGFRPAPTGPDDLVGTRAVTYQPLASTEGKVVVHREMVGCQLQASA